MRAADPRTVETVAPLVEAELAARPLAASFSERVAARLAATLPNGTDMREVARAMHMSARTLQRRLGQEDTQFSEVLDRARLGVARGLLLDPGVALSEAAVRLGLRRPRDVQPRIQALDGQATWAVAALVTTQSAAAPRPSEGNACFQTRARVTRYRR